MNFENSYIIHYYPGVYFLKNGNIIARNYYAIKTFIYVIFVLYSFSGVSERDLNSMFD